MDLMTEISSTKSYEYLESLTNGYNPNIFIEKKRYKTIDEMLTDENVFGILEFKKRFILSTGYRFIDKEDNSADNEIVEFLKYNFEDKYKGQLTDDLYGILTSQEYGVSTSEKIYCLDKKSGKILNNRIKTIPPHSYDFFTDDMGELEKIVQRQGTNPQVELPLNKMLIMSNNKRFDAIYGKSDMERCYRAWFSKNLVIKLWNVYLQRFASPFPVAKVDDNLGETKINKLMKILNSIQQTVSIIVPKGVELDLHKAGDSSGEYDKAIERYNQMIARALLLPDLMGFGQTTGGGSYSLGNKHYEMFVNICDSVRHQIEDLFNEEVIKPLIDMNFGEQEHYPKFEFLPYQNENLKDLLGLFLQALDKGMPRDLNDWNHFREFINFPEISKELEDEINTDIEDMKIVPKATDSAGSMQNPQDSISPEDESVASDIIDENMPEDDDKELTQSVFTERKIKLSRTPNKYEARIDFVQQQVTLEDQMDSSIKQLAKYCGYMREGVKDTISKKQIVTNSNFDEIDKIQLKYLGEIKQIMEQDATMIYIDARTVAAKEVQSLPKQVNNTKAVNDTRLTPNEAIKQAKKLINARTFQAVGKLKDDLLNKVKQALINGLEKGTPQNEIMQKIDIIFNDVTEGAPTAKLNTEPSLLNTIVRTNYNNFYNLGRRQIANENPYVMMLQYSAVMDDLTTEICQQLDGLMYKYDDPIWDNITPPNHFNCRSRINYITDIDVEVDNLSPDKAINVESLANKYPSYSSFLGE